MEHLNGKPGQYFTLAETLQGVEDILNGKTVTEQAPQKEAAKK